MRVIQPGRTGIVEIGQGAFFQVGFMPRFGNRAFRKSGLFFLRGDDPINPFRRVQPVFAELVEGIG